MDWKIIHIDETDSTNHWLKSHQLIANSPEPTAIWADYQTAGRGCGTNTWESERGKNLLFSMLIHPENLPANKQFQISMAISLAIVDALGQLVGDLSIKWPNDIYWRNGKIGGILIENTLKGNLIKESIIGVGLNVNQREFHSDAPNPVSLWQITKGFHPYADKNGVFMAEITGVEEDGHLLLLDDNGKQRRYAFKEVQFII